MRYHCTSELSAAIVSLFGSIRGKSSHVAGAGRALERDKAQDLSDDLIRLGSECATWALARGLCVVFVPMNIINVSWRK